MPVNARDTSSEGPLKDLRVIDLGHDYSAPFAATLLADFGADVIKVEKPGRGDVMRDVGPRSSTGPVVWKSAGRNKKLLGLDWKNEHARPVLERLVRWADVLVESYRPGVLEKNNLGPSTLFSLNPNLVVLRISGYGQTGPYHSFPGFGKVGEALSGFCDLTGSPEGPPTHAGFPMADMTSGLMGAFGIMVAIYALRGGVAKGQVIDLALYEAPLRLIDFHVPIRTALGLIPKRNGNRHPLSMAMSGMYQSAEGQWITYSAGSFDVAKRVLRMIGGDALADDPRFTDLRSICRHDDEIHSRMTTWFRNRTARDALEAFRRADAVAAPIYSVDDILADPQVTARGNIVGVADDPCKVVNVVPSLSATPGHVRWFGGEIGEHSMEILRSLQFSDEEIRALLDSGAISDSKSGT